MPARLKVLFLPHPNGPAFFTPWGEDVVEGIGDRHDFRILDLDQPYPPQFEWADVVIDHGGEWGCKPDTAQKADLARIKPRLWQVLGTGLDRFHLDEWRALGIPVANTPGQFSAVALAETAMMLLLMVAHKIPVAQKNFEIGKMYQPLGLDLEGLTLGIIGFGASGREFARRARPFGMKFMAIDVRDVGADEIAEFGLDFVGKPADLDYVVAQSDVLSLHLHLNAETRHIIDDRRLRLMKPTAILINVARGALVDEDALAEALLSERLGGAGLDVFGKEPPDPNAPMYHLPNVVVTPHIAGVTRGTSRRRAQCCVDNVDRIANGLEPLYRVV